jgi:hypothetical protein
LLLQRAGELLLLGGQRRLDRRQPLQLATQLLHPLLLLAALPAQRLLLGGELRERVVLSLEVLCAAWEARVS